MGSDFSPFFEGAVVAVEIFAVYLYIAGIFPKKNRLQISVFATYIVFGLALGAASLYYPDMILLPLITFIGVFGITLFMYKGHILTKLFASFMLVLLVIAIEAITALVHAWIFDVDLLHAHSSGAERSLFSVISKLLILLAVRVIVLFMKKHRDSLHRRMLQSIPLIICQLILIIIIASEFFNSYVVYGELNARSFFVMGGLFFINIVVILYFDLLYRLYELRHENEIANMQLDNQVKYYDTITSHQEIINAIEHDMNKHIKVIRDMTKTGHNDEVADYLNRYTGTIKGNMCLVFTPHPLLSSILSDCRQRATKARTDLHLDVSVPSVIDINNIDLTVILGNTIDNALEALDSIAPEKRKLRISLKQSDYYLFYEITNTYSPQSAHKKTRDKAYHGYGLNNVRVCVEKYDGTFDVKQKEEEFTVTILIPSQLAFS